MMTERALRRTTVLALTWLGGAAGHEAGDYLVQRDADAQSKQHCDQRGRRALFSHVASYAATQLVAKLAVCRAAGTDVPLRALVYGELAEAVLHGVIDDGRPLRRFAAATGKTGFHDLNTGGVCGRALMDQAAHKALQLPIGAIVTALAATRREVAR